MGRPFSRSDRSQACDRPRDQAALLRPQPHPLYLLVDREASSVTLFSDPENADYRQLGTRPFGKPLPLPDPFGFELETSDFL